MTLEVPWKYNSQRIYVALYCRKISAEMELQPIIPTPRLICSNPQDSSVCPPSFKAQNKPESGLIKNVDPLSYCLACKTSIWIFFRNLAKVVSLLEACFDLIWSPSPSLNTQIMSGKITENLGFEFPLQQVKNCSFSVHFQILHKMHIFVLQSFYFVLQIKY